MPQPRTENPITRIVAESLVVLVACGLLLWVVRANVAWFERHVMQSYIVPRERYARKIAVLRLLCAGFSAALVLFVRPAIGRWAGHRGAAALGKGFLRIVFLGLLFTVLLEGVLRLMEQDLLRRRQKDPLLELRVGRVHPRYGWLWKPSLRTVVHSAHHDVVYAFDAQSHRSATPGGVPDLSRPTLLFTGESIAAGHALDHRESYAARVGARLGMQSVNLAVSGYASDQAYLRLRDELPRYAHPVAVVTLFLPALLDRTARDFRPHLHLSPGGSLELLPPATGPWARLRLRKYLRNVVPYHSEARNTEMLALVGTLFSETACLSRERGAVPIFLVPSLGPPRSLSDHPEAWIVRELFEARGLDYVLVDLDPTWVLPDDPHPDARAHRAMADAIYERLRDRLRAR